MTTHEHSSASAGELIAEAKVLLTMEKLDAWRRIQNAQLARLMLKDGKINFTAEAELNNSLNELIDEYLSQNGLSENDEHYNEIRQLYLDASIGSITENEWCNRPSARGQAASDDRPQKYIFVDRMNDMLGNDPDSEPDDDREEPEAEESERLEKLEELKKAKQEAYVAMINTGRYSPKRKKRMEAYEAAEAAYAEALEEDIRLRLEEQLGDDLNEDQRAEIIKELADDQIHGDEEEQHTLLLERGGKRARFLAKYDSWSLKKKIGVGVAFGAVGAGAGFLLGLAGAGAAAIGAGVAGYRFGRNAYLAKSRIYRKPSSQTDFTYNASSELSAEKQVVGHLNGRARSRIEAADKAKERAVKIGLGAAALGGTVSGVAGAAGTFLHAESISVAGHSIGLNDGHRWLGYIKHLRPGSGDGAPSTPVIGDVDMSDVGTSDSGGDVSIDNPVQDELANLSEAAQTIRNGEGWYETFSDHGIDSAHHAELLKEVGPKLDEAYPDLAYFDNAANEWRIGYSGDLPKGASEIILEAANEHGWLPDSAVADSAAGATDAATDTAATANESVVSQPFNVEDDNGYTHELIDTAEAKGVDITPQQAFDAHKTIVDTHGPDYIELTNHDGPDTYSMGPSDYETGISAPGEATWATEAQPMVDDATDDGVINGSIDTDAMSATADAAQEAQDTGVGDSDIAGATEGFSDSDWEQFENMLEEFAENDRLAELSGYAPTFMDELGPQLADIVYPDGTHIAEIGANGSWTLIDSEQMLPQQALDVIYKYMEQNDAAAEAAKQLAEVL